MRIASDPKSRYAENAAYGIVRARDDASHAAKCDLANGMMKPETGY